MDRESRNADERRERSRDAPVRMSTSPAPLPERQGRPGGDRYYLLEFLAVFFTLFGGELLFRGLTGWVQEGEMTVSSVVATAVVDVGFCLLAWVLLTRREGFDWRLPRTAVKWAQELGWAFLLILAILGCTFVLSLIIFPLALESSAVAWAGLTGKPAALAVLCLITPIVGLGEELIFRVYVQTRLTQILGGRKVLPVVLGTVLFAAVHGYPWMETLVVGMIGLVLAFSFQANGKIPRLVIAHTLWNLMALLLPLVPDGFGPETALG